VHHSPRHNQLREYRGVAGAQGFCNEPVSMRHFRQSLDVPAHYYDQYYQQLVNENYGVEPAMTNRSAANSVFRRSC